MLWPTLTTGAPPAPQLTASAVLRPVAVHTDYMLAARPSSTTNKPLHECLSRVGHCLMPEQQQKPWPQLTHPQGAPSPSAVPFRPEVGGCCRVEWEFWTSSNDGCGRACDRQGAFKRDFQAAAMQFEQVCLRAPVGDHCCLHWRSGPRCAD